MQNFFYDTETRLVSGAFLQSSHSQSLQNQGDDGKDPQCVQRSNVPSNDPDYNGAYNWSPYIGVICVGGCPEDFCSALFKHCH